MESFLEKFQSYHKDLSPSKVARKYEYLTEDSFRFFRGTTQLFYEDLQKNSLAASPVCWISGDLHLENFGSYKGDNRLVYFDINDFDESTLAPVSWDVLRMITSILVGFNDLHITDKEAEYSCRLFIKKYTETLTSGNPRYIECRTARGIIKKFLNKVEDRTLEEALSKRTKIKNGKLRLCSHHKKQLKIDKNLKHELIPVFEEWMTSNNAPPNDYKVLDARFRFAGTGSIGVQRYIFLIEKNKDAGKHMLIDMKQATASCLKSYISHALPKWKTEAERIIYLQKMMQNVTPAQLSALRFKNNDFILQELQPTKDRINFKIIQDNFKTVCNVIEDMAMLTASAHLRGVSRKGAAGADDLIAFGADKSWINELFKYAVHYKNKVCSDYTKFCAEMKERRS